MALEEDLKMILFVYIGRSKMCVNKYVYAYYKHMYMLYTYKIK